ncbi:hypothetical protein UFOVP787_20 [uncultured Caudovirales phage]|uniref:DUF7201 domain-containing protein n=1 Tax=uncultured Caudovirales phage TaxID=2100421 RepID=A0A6J5NZ27_9CAUD|nr:hypothetical protein UFOVP787_20 [uncultured Caudovirales phage]
MSSVNLIEKRQDRIEDAIEKLTTISADLNKMVAVQEQRINQQENKFVIIENVIEKRREESDIKLKDVYDTMRSEDSSILVELNNIRKEASEQHEKLSKKISDSDEKLSNKIADIDNKLSEKISVIEKKLWMYGGGLAVIIFVLSNGSNIISLFSFLSKIF